MVEETVDKDDSSDSLDSEPPGDKLRFLRFLRGRPFRFGAEIQKGTGINLHILSKKQKITVGTYNLCVEFVLHFISVTEHLILLLKALWMLNEPLVSRCEMRHLAHIYSYQ
jgi:hypothetical protein